MVITPLQRDACVPQIVRLIIYHKTINRYVNNKKAILFIVLYYHHSCKRTLCACHSHVQFCSSALPVVKKTGHNEL